MIKNSMKQMFRTPVRTFLFLFLITVSGIFLSVGGNLWVKNQGNINNYEDIFVTIGTVKQKPSSIAQEMVWDAEKKDYVIRQWAEYSKLYSTSILSFEGADYIQEPEKRSYYGSYAPGYQLVGEDTSWSYSIVAEFSPRENCIPNESVQIDIKKVLGENKEMEGVTLWFCNHWQENPEPIYKDKTYIGCLLANAWTHGDRYETKEGTEDMTLEYIPYLPIPTQYAEDGSRIENILKDFFTEESPLYFELEEGFYESKLGKHYLSLVEGNAMLEETFPVTGTNATILLMPFYTGDAYISGGRDILEEEYEAGEKVCLISKKFAENNQLLIGEIVQTQLYYTNVRNTASRNFHRDGSGGFNFRMIDSEGRAPAIFEKSQYTIVGIYDVLPGADQGDYGMGGDEMIVPMNSIENRSRYNVFSYGPMAGSTTSFQIPNGTIDSFMKEWDKLEIEDLEITFYDGGYSKLQNGIENMKYMSLILFAVGIGMSISLLFLYSHLFITSQKQRTAIERSLGVRKSQCRESLLFSLLFILFIGSVLGCGIGGFLSRSIDALNLNQVDYDRTYSNVADIEVEEEDLEENSSQSTILIVSLSCTGLIFLSGAIISISKMNKNLNCEPMKLLSEKNNNL